MSNPLLNAKQTAVLDYIRQQIEHQGYPPSVREIGGALGIASSSTVHAYLRQLEALGCIRRDPAKPRAMVVEPMQVPAETHQPLPETQSAFEAQLPLIDYDGLAAAGFDMTRCDSENIRLSIRSLLPLDQACLFNMPDDSMIKIGIFPGDHLIIGPEQPRNGDVILACVNNSLTVKTYFKGIRQLRLQPENDWYEPIYLSEQEMIYIGKVRANIRQF